MKKGQAAMEFLMTYGWAILVVLAAVGALAYFGVLDSSSLFPEKCDFGGQGLTCLDKPSIDASAETVTLAFKNNVGERVNITGVATSAGDDCTLSQFELCDSISSCSAAGAAKVVANDANFILKVTCTEDLDGKFKSDFTLTYTNMETGLPHDVTGQIRGSAN